MRFWFIIVLAVASLNSLHGQTDGILSGRQDAIYEDSINVSIDYEYSNVFFYCLDNKDSSYNGKDTVYLKLRGKTNELPVAERITAVITYRNGLKVNVAAYYDNGQIHRETYFDGKRMSGMDIKWHRNGRKAMQTYYMNGKRIFPLLTWYDNGELEGIIDFDAESNNGMIKEWYPNGNTKRYYSSIDTAIGCAFEVDYYENGQASAARIVNCGKQSVFMFYDNGEKYAEGFIVNTLFGAVGKWVEWYRNGQKKTEGEFDENNPGNRQGVWSYWDELGNLIKKEYYEHGELLKTEFFDAIKMKKKRTDD